MYLALGMATLLENSKDLLAVLDGIRQSLARSRGQARDRAAAQTPPK